MFVKLNVSHVLTTQTYTETSTQTFPFLFGFLQVYVVLYPIIIQEGELLLSLNILENSIPPSCPPKIHLFDRNTME